ncbi:MAG: glucose-6-phosphate isomerase [Alphaproteobacteria bacterium]|jgi:glucose-6-phosphate isomerase|nr:glucose-6-phosphate isomerase [Alphaproteobacteria bacterium]MDP6588325.1 glucose-6-phosphate isomerase [Alphaproteobacteria bacterium]MDP6816825.1 glucose-6-phosphate isomerase [Alphaproteobacteria bacterium]|tara:strand:+ start:1409 stop:2668 length:1260 start_codon:yes stop_codon:yes gene_type:complete
MRYQHHSENCFSDRIGENGVAPDAYAEALARTAPALEQIAEWHASGAHAFLSYPDKSDDLPEFERTAQEMRQRFDRIAVIGVGGASLGGQAVTALAAETETNATPITFLDNPNSARLEAALAGEAKTGFITISKSGASAETLAQTLLALDRAPPRNFLFITGPGDNPLRRIAAELGIAVLDHDPGLGGRFSVFSAVGVLPALIAGLDPGALRSGAGETLDAALSAAEPAAVPSAVGAALALAMAKRLSAAVFMPYDDRLLALAHWQRQLWAESLGKDGQGATPVVARGAIDQHSQLQLYLDGPADKLFTLITTGTSADGPRIAPDMAATAGADYLAGHSLGDLMAAEASATRVAIGEAGRPLREIVVPVLDEAAMGALMMHFMLETVIIALCLNIDPFNQPSVERGKQLARDYLRRGRS